MPDTQHDKKCEAGYTGLSYRPIPEYWQQQCGCRARARKYEPCSLNNPYTCPMGIEHTHPWSTAPSA